MFSKNNKISKRQMFRLLTYDLLGIGTLLLPAALARHAGKNGMAAIGIGIVAGALYCLFSGWVISFMKEGETYPDFLKRRLGTFFGTAALVFYVLYYICLGGYSTYIFGHLMVTDLLKEQSFYWIVGGILLLAAYGIFQGIEGRARIYEILFWFLMAPLFIMLFLAAKDIELPRLFPLYAEPFSSAAVGGYFCFEMFSLGGFAFFLAPFAKKKDAVRGALLAAVVFSGLVLFAIYLILQGIFGTEAMRALEYPAVSLMSMVQIPGGFLERQDAIMVAVWFFTVFALLSSSMFYAAESLKAFTKGKKEKLFIVLSAAAFFGIAVCSYRSADFTNWLHDVFLFAATPLVVLIPLVVGVCAKFGRTGKRAARCVALLCLFLTLSGCSTSELENRKFPLAMGVDAREGGCLISYKFQDLSAIADQNASAPDGTDFFIEDRDFFTGISKYANDTNKLLDYNHMKALVLSEDFFEEEESLIGFLQVCGKESLIARNTLLFLAEDAAEILALDENLDTAIGSYLEEMMESREDYQLKDAVTLGDLYNDLANQEQLLLIPVLAEEGGLPIIRSYYALSCGAAKGEIGVQEAALSYLSQNKLRTLSFSLDEQNAVRINRIKAKGRFVGGKKPVYRSSIRLEAVVEKELDTGSGAGEALRRQIKTLFERQMKQSAENLLTAPGIDLTNSYYKLGLYGGGMYKTYQDDPEGYLSDLQLEFEAEVILLNERG